MKPNFCVILYLFQNLCTCLFSCCKCGFREEWDFFGLKIGAQKFGVPTIFPNQALDQFPSFLLEVRRSKLGPHARGMRFQNEPFFSFRSFQISFQFICKLQRNDQRLFLQKSSKVLCNKHFINQNSESTQQAASTYRSGGNTCFMGNNGASISVIPHLSSDLFFDRKWPKITLI